MSTFRCYHFCPLGVQFYVPSRLLCRCPNSMYHHAFFAGVQFYVPSRLLCRCPILCTITPSLQVSKFYVPSRSIRVLYSVLLSSVSLVALFHIETQHAMSAFLSFVCLISIIVVIVLLCCVRTVLWYNVHIALLCSVHTVLLCNVHTMVFLFHFCHRHHIKDVFL